MQGSSGYIGEIQEKTAKTIDIKIVLLHLLSFAMGLFLSRCGIRGLLFPFAQGYVICMYAYTNYAKGAFLGALLGWLSLFPNVPYNGIFVCVMCVGTVLVLKRKYKFNKIKLLKLSFATYSILGVFIFGWFSSFFILISLGEALISILSLVMLDRTLNLLVVRKKRSALSDDEAICIVFCLCAFVISAVDIAPFDIDLGIVLASFFTMAFAYLFGSLVGCSAGIIMGLCISLGGGSIYVMGTMAVCGFISGLVNKQYRIFLVLVYIVSNALLTLYINGSSFTILPIQSSIIAGGALILIPVKVVDYFKELFLSSVNKSKQEKYYYEKYNELARNKIHNVSKLFFNISELFSMGEMAPKCDLDMGNIIEQVSEHSCKGCERFDTCWKENFYDTYALFETMVDTYNKSGDCQKIKLPCLNKPGVEKSIDKVLKNIDCQAKLEKKIEESKDLVSKQLYGVGDVLSRLDTDLTKDVEFKRDIERNIKEDLILRDIPVFDVCVLEVSGVLKCEVVLSSSVGTMNYKSKIEKTVSSYCKKNMCIEDYHLSTNDKKKSTLIISEVKPLKVSTYIAQYSKEDICGDNYKISYISDNQYMMCLSDGMGSGKKAGEQSRSCLTLLEDFFKAGFDKEIIFDTVNKLLVLKNIEDMFTTVDLCMVNLVRKKAMLTKIGAVPSFIFHKDKGTSIIYDNSLPMGILNEIEPKEFSRDIQDGDVLIMMTDGVFDKLGGMDNIQNIDGILQRIIGNSNNYKEKAGDILSYAKNIGDTSCLDDMTILISVFKNRKNG